jgi:endonuclease/exonuclease/phosphatase family metal-dependent hydrolase
VPSKEPTSRIDYIFFRKGDPFEPVEARVVPEAMASDHRPVFAVLRIKAG